MSDLIFIDTETGGLDIRRHSLLEVGLMAVRSGGQYLKTYRTYVKQEEYLVTSGAMKVNKLPINYVYENGRTPEQIVSDIEAFVREHFGDQKPMLAGHNTDFDRRMLQTLFMSVGKNIDDYLSYRVVDTAVMIRVMKEAGMLPEEFPNGLHDAARALGIQFDEGNIHTVLEDLDITRALYYKLLRIMKGEEQYERPERHY